MKRVSLNKTTKTVLATLGVVALLGGTFYAGMAFENYRIQEEFQSAFSLEETEDDGGLDGDELTGDEGDGDGDGAQVREETAGQFFEYTADYTDEEPQALMIRLERVTCGETVLKGPDEYTDDVSADAGNEFCKAVGTARNDSQTPGSPLNFGSLITEDGEFAYDDEVEMTFAEEGESINPGSKTTFTQYYQVPEGTKATGVMYPEQRMDEDEQVLINLQ